MSRAWRSAAKLLTKDEAWRIAANVAKLPQTVAKAISLGKDRTKFCAWS